MNESAPVTASIPRRHDLDALRGIAMLLGIILHGAMSFIPVIGVFWPVEDNQPNGLFGLLVGAIHGFRMPLFFLISGFFTTMLCRKRGLSALLEHRFKRIFLPLVLGLCTVIPLTWTISDLVRSGPTETAASAEEMDIFLASVSGNEAALSRLIGQGTNLNQLNKDGASPLHIAIFFGYADCTEVLLKGGADIDFRDKDGRPASDNIQLPWDLTNYIARTIPGLKLDRKKWFDGRRRIAESMNVPLDPAVDAGAPGSGATGHETGSTWPALDVTSPILGHLWFLWFLSILVVVFAALLMLTGVLGLQKFPGWLTVPGWRFFWIIPITAIPQFYMIFGPTAFGPATSLSLIPLPSVLIYYAIFFFFGAFYFDAQDDSGRLGRFWWILLPVAVLVLFPIGLASVANPKDWPAAALVQSGYTWCASLGMIGLFRTLLSRENKVMRYLSDSSYWLYLAHIPLIIYMQHVVRSWQMAAGVKFMIVCFITSGVLLLTYQMFVRHTPIGTLLNGPRRREKAGDRSAEAVVPSAP